MGGSARALIASLSRIIYPEVCAVCHRSLIEGEQAICLSCLANMPRTRMHLNPFNSIHERLAAPGLLTDRAAAWFHYLRGNPYSAIIHDAKYRGLPSVARRCGELFATELSTDRFFDNIDILLPVPLHKSKLNRRGYNQALEIAKGVSAVTGIPIGENIVCTRSHDSQTNRNAWQRWLNARDTYSITSAHELSGLHALIIDDVVTTGATLLACLQAVRKESPSTRTSVLTLAATHLQ